MIFDVLKEVEILSPVQYYARQFQHSLLTDGHDILTAAVLVWQHCRGLDVLLGFHCFLPDDAAMKSSVQEGLVRRPHSAGTEHQEVSEAGVLVQ